MNQRRIFLLQVSCFLVVASLSGPVSGQFGHYGPKPYSYEQKEKVFLKLERDPGQVRPTKPTPDNMFSWLNLRNVVRFHLWTRKNPHLAQELRLNDPQSVRTSNFDPTRLTKIIIHGWADGASEVQIGTWIIEMRDAYLAMADVNYIAIDYAPLASFYLYFSAVPEMVGERVAEMISYMHKSHNLAFDPLHIIGWSWGAQIAGMAGHRLQGKIGRITGIDPAGPTFKYVDDEFRLDKTDAKFVDVIHVNGGKLLFWGYYGLEDSIGHVDIFPNGGRKQIGCPVERTLIYETLWCSHGRGVRYFTESISSPVGFPACRCSSFDSYLNGDCKCEEKTYMGEHLSIHSPPGNYYLVTRAKTPYGHGQQLNVSLVPDIKTAENVLRPKLDVTVKLYGNESSGSPEPKVEHFLMRNTYNALNYPNDHILELSLALTRENATSNEVVDRLKNVELVIKNENDESSVNVHTNELPKIKNATTATTTTVVPEREDLRAANQTTVKSAGQ